MTQPRERKMPSGLSPTSIGLYLQCPRKFEAQKIDGLHEPPGPEAVLGTFVHAILEYVMGLPADERTLESAKECARKAWAETEVSGDFKSLKMNDEKRKQFRWSGWTSVETYFGMEDLREIEVVATERMVNVEVGGVKLRGIIDRLDREGSDLIVADYKNGKVPDPKYRKSKWDQLNIYAAMVEATQGETPTKGRLLFTAHGEILETPFSAVSIKAVVDQAVQVWSDIQADFDGRGFKPITGPLCGWCPLLAQCPEGMANTRMIYLKGRLKKTAPGYSLVSGPRGQG